MKQIICLFEDAGYQNLLPLVYTRPVYDLRCGILSIGEKVKLHFSKAKIILHVRSYLSRLLELQNPDTDVNKYDYERIIFINGRLLIDDEIKKQIIKHKDDFILVTNGTVAVAKLSGINITKIKFDEYNTLNLDGVDIPRYTVDSLLINYPWELINNNGKQIINDYELLSLKNRTTGKFKNVEFINKKRIYIGKSTKIDPFAVLDASNGPIYITNNVHIMAHTYIQGPVSIGDNSTIKAHSTIYNNTSIGQVCKIGGEVEGSIIHSYSNKQHEGFLGHSYLGSWVNIGASTNNSDLKNNYSPVDVFVNGQKVQSNSLFVGLIMGDHSKTAINTMFNTGTVVGVSCNIFGADFPPKYIPSFSWGGSSSISSYNMDKAIETAIVVKKRRGFELTAIEIELLKEIYKFTEIERK